MKRQFFILMLVAFAISFVSFASAANSCQLGVTVLNQDPVQAVPGDYVKLVFQLTGIGNPDCGTIRFSVVQDYPFSLDAGANDTAVIQSGAYTPSYSSQATVPFTLRVDANALNKNYTLKTQYRTASTGATAVENNFTISVQDIKADFDIFVQDYDTATHMITLDILNTGDNGVDALTAQISNLDSISVKGSTTAVIGSLDASQDTTFNYEIAPVKSDIHLNIAYTDNNGNRRVLQKAVQFDPSFFSDRQGDAKSGGGMWFVIILIILIVVGVWYWRRRARKKREHLQHLHNKR